jgi:hypothetical protein
MLGMVCRWFTGPWQLAPGLAWVHKVLSEAALEGFAGTSSPHGSSKNPGREMQGGIANVFSFVLAPAALVVICAHA